MFGNATDVSGSLEDPVVIIIGTVALGKILVLVGTELITLACADLDCTNDLDIVEKLAADVYNKFGGYFEASRWKWL